MVGLRVQVLSGRRRASPATARATGVRFGRPRRLVGRLCQTVRCDRRQEQRSDEAEDHVNPERPAGTQRRHHRRRRPPRRRVADDRVARGERRDQRARQRRASAVNAAIAALNYVPNQAARRLAGSQPIRIGVLYSNPSAGYLSEFLVGVLEQASRRATSSSWSRSARRASRPRPRRATCRQRHRRHHPAAAAVRLGAAARPDRARPTPARRRSRAASPTSASARSASTTTAPPTR